MSQFLPSSSNAPARIVGLGALVSELIVLVLTLAIATTFVVGLTMFRRDRYELNLRERVSFDEPKIGYGALVGDYLAGLLQGQFVGAKATAYERKYVNTMIVSRGQHSLQLLGVTLAVALPLGLIWGGLMANMGGVAGRAVFGLGVLALSLPSFFVLIVMIELIVNLSRTIGVQLIFTQGYGLDRHLIVPVTVLALRGAAYLAVALKSAQEEIAQQDYIRVARAKGLSGVRLWRTHMLPLLYVPFVGGALGMLRLVVGGMILVEYLYNWNGLSKLLLQVNQSGSFDYRPEPVEVGAAVLLAVFFVVTDALGRLALWGAAAQRREAA